MILKHQLRHHFVIHCIDNAQNLPKEIDRVPMLMHENKLLSDEGLFAYIEGIANNSTIKKNVSPFLVGEMGNSISDQYSYLEENDSGNITHNFVHLKDGEQLNNEPIYTPEDDSVNSSDKNYSYDDLLNRREHELNKMIKT